MDRPWPTQDPAAREGGLPNHVCFAVDHIEAEVARPPRTRGKTVLATLVDARNGRRQIVRRVVTFTARSNAPSPRPIHGDAVHKIIQETTDDD